MEILVPKPDYPEEGKRYGSRQLDWSDTVPKYWRHKETHVMVEVQQYLRAYNETGAISRLVIFQDTMLADVRDEKGNLVPTETLQSFRMDLKRFQEEYEPFGNYPVRPKRRRPT